jgi:iron-sulfur cluster assembly accessory protein|tara:strand:- start:1444 stop:1782 length:339 start_codon:yes stop_codon:yes gene_type:complete
MNITVTTSAQEKIAEMCVENDMVGIRAFISGGGCAGLQHGLGFLEIIEDKDTLVAPNFYVDPVAMSYLDGSTIDYDESGMSPTFIFKDVFKSQGGTGTCGGCGAAMGPGNRH